MVPQEVDILPQRTHNIKSHRRGQAELHVIRIPLAIEVNVAVLGPAAPARHPNFIEALVHLMTAHATCQLEHERSHVPVHAARYGTNGRNVRRTKMPQ